MAEKKTVDETKIEEIETKKEETEPEMVEVFLMKDNDKYKEDVFVGLNGTGYIVKRGQPVKVPKGVYEILKNSMEQDANAAKLMDTESEAFENGLKTLI